MDPIKKKEFLNIPNYISLGRIVAVPLLVVLMIFISDEEVGRSIWNATWSLMACLVYVLASLSDMVDGIIARRKKIESSFGKFFDPLADKLLNLAAMIMLIPLERIPAWLVILLMVREITITMLRGVAANERIVIAASKWGKYKNAFGSIAIAGLILHYPFFGVQWKLIGWVFLVITAVFTVGSGVHYVWEFVRKIKAQTIETPGV